jgi:hypothetical protein
MATCKGCGASIMWGVDDQTGAKVPLDLKAPVYHLKEKVGKEQPLTRAGRDAALVSHFSVCPQANRFSASNKQHELPIEA